ncbi:hypothetical protein R1sor_013403 [Riccia sorocarpa]|uniref:Uncharacterized protein n=1 Tax=Riccia sorocarpa TaxID=122646 RepID=A0ABD3HCL9_9MARC
MLIVQLLMDEDSSDEKETVSVGTKRADLLFEPQLQKITSAASFQLQCELSIFLWHLVVYRKGAVLEPTLRREQAARTRRRRLQGRPDYAESGHEVREELVNYVAARNM